MKSILSKIQISQKEFLFQLILHGIVFLFYSFNRFSPEGLDGRIIFFMNYTLSSLLINYYLLPRYYYRKKYLQFFVSIVLIVILLLLVEEYILEPIYFPDTRARYFPGVIVSLLGVLPIIAILSGFKFAWDALHKQQQVDSLQTLAQESELQFLQSQINPHFLFNNLNNLYSFAISNSPRTPEIIMELSNLMRYMLYECKEKYVPIEKEILQLENFIKLNEIQIEGRGKVTFRVEDIHPGHVIAPLILISFIENAFKHSSSSQTDNINIAIVIRLSDSGQLHFICHNNYEKLSNTSQLSGGIGLKNVQKRLNLLYPSSHQLDIAVSDHEYSVNLVIDLN